jgi:hypothetical protein
MSAEGAMIMSMFAAVWWAVGIGASGHGSVPMYAIPVLVTVAIIAAASRRRADTTPVSPEEHARRGRLFGVASGVEGLLIFVAVNVLANLKKLDFAAPVIAMIVGLHFVPLARGLPARSYYVTSALLVALGVAGLSVPGANQRLLAVSVGAACVLWLTCAFVLQAKPTGNRTGAL